MEKILRFLVLLLLCACSQSNLPAPYGELEKVLPFDGQGWYNNRRQMKELLQKHKVKTVIEVGCWLGKSTRHIARTIPKDGRVYAVDHWLGSLEHQGNEILPKLYAQFLSNVIHKKLCSKIIPIRSSSVEAEKMLPGVIADLIYIDASHETEAVYRDLCTWYPHLKKGGILCGDDWCWSSVQEAVEQFAQERGLEVHSDQAFWQLVDPALKQI